MPSEEELCGIAGIKDVQAAAKVISKKLLSPAVLIVKCGAKGAFVMKGEKVVAESKCFPVEVIDATGAGDAFNSGFLSRFLQGSSLQQALDYACACGAIRVNTMSASDNAPSHTTVAALVASRSDALPYVHRHSDFWAS